MTETTAEGVPAHWRAAAADLGLQLIAPCHIEVDGSILSAPFLVRNFGHKHGMAVFERYDAVRLVAASLVDLGFGYSVIDLRPTNPYDRDAFIEMLSDWGWTGDPAAAPDWLIP